uniref:Integrase, catalytic region, zinc finger, CCHC-type, peptidase aspartic, catalytic n=1 Tax=Tanacetum cinerariifolium TaxID=118510 RepID=A0A6L2JKU3_TANCI|nr:integrase, catalytic region, zinc finger, CCHC-type, peptidase aspartic, catalytic [Tanacetum cinerariifolium]
MSTLDEFMIVVGAENRPPMLDKPHYKSWKHRIELYIQEDDTVRLKTYEELSDKEKLQTNCDLKATNMVLQGLSLNVYALVNHHKIAKDIWDRVKLLMQGTSLSRQERECKLYDEFDKFSHVKGLQGNASGSRGNTSGQVKVIKCYNCQGEGHMARQCTQQKRRRDAAWFKEKVLLVQAHAEGKKLDEEQLAFLADPRVTYGQVAQTITHNAAFQTDDLDAYDSDCDDIPSAKEVLMANLSSYDSDVLSEVKEKESLLTTLNGFKTKFKERESKSIHKEIVLENKNKELDNIVSEDFGKRFVPQQELSSEQKFWLLSFDKNSEEPSTSNTPVKIEVSSELSKEMLRNFHGRNLSKGNIIKIFYPGLNNITQEVLNAATGGIFLYKTPNQAYQLLEDKVLLKIDRAKNQKTKSSLKKIVAFVAEAKKVLRAATSPCHYISQNCITMSSPDHSTSNNEDAFSSNIPDYVSTILDYFPASSRKTYSNASNNSTGKIPPEFSLFYNMKDIQAFYAKEVPISSPNPITPPIILTPSPVLPPSLLFDPRYFFVPEELLPPKKQIHPHLLPQLCYLNQLGNKSILMNHHLP